MDNNEGSLGLAGLKDGSINAYFNGNWNYDKVKEALGEENVGVAALPTINIGGKDCQLKAFLGSKAIGVNPNCKNQEVAVKACSIPWQRGRTACSLQVKSTGSCKQRSCNKRGNRSRSCSSSYG